MSGKMPMSTNVWIKFDLWFFWPMLGCGIGVLFHGMKVFNYMPFFGKDWEEKKIQEFMEKDKSEKWE